MVFSSNVFLFLFLPVFLGLYYLSGERYRNLLLLIASYVFYAWWRVDFLLLFAGVTVFNYWIGLRIGAAGVRTRAAQRWLILGVVVDLCVLGYFKYANFGVDSLNEIITSFGMQPFVLTHILLPIGISFYTFESISYIIDVYRGDTPATHNLIDFAAFVAIFPHLIAGPVLRFKDLVDQFNHRTHTVDKFAEGCTRFMQGFVKKVFIADTLAALADHCFALQNPTTGDAWLGALAYTAQALLRLLRLQRHGHRPRPDDGLPLHGELQPALHQPVDHRVLAALAHQPVDLAARLPLHQPGRQPRQHLPDLPQPVPDHAPRRPVARRQLHLHHLGRLARHVAGDRAGPRGERRAARAQPVEVGVHLPPGGDRLGDLPRREPAGRLAHVRSHVQLRHLASSPN